jgi:hypothetical protein
MLGRAIDQGRELLPPEILLPKDRKKYLLWRDTARIPRSDMIDGLDLEDRVWQELSIFLQKQWEFLTEKFVQARESDKFLADLSLNTLLPIRCTQSTFPVMASGARSDSTMVSSTGRLSEPSGD